MIDADKAMNKRYFGSDPAAIWIRIWINPEIWINLEIWINPEIWIRIPHHFWLRLDALAEVCATDR